MVSTVSFQHSARLTSSSSGLKTETTYNNARGMLRTSEITLWCVSSFPVPKKSTTQGSHEREGSAKSEYGNKLINTFRESICVCEWHLSPIRKTGRSSFFFFKKKPRLNFAASGCFQPFSCSCFKPTSNTHYSCLVVDWQWKKEQLCQCSSATMLLQLGVDCIYQSFVA